MNMRLSVITFLTFWVTLTAAQDTMPNEEQAPKKQPNIQLEGDSRQTFVNNNSVGIYGMRIGTFINEKTQVGLGGYSSNLFGVLGRSVSKDYRDFSEIPPAVLPAEIGFHYFSIFGEYTLIHNNRLILTTNSQFGLGWVDIDIVDSSFEKENIRERKSLIEHSVKVDVKTFEWLRLMGGIGYRYLLTGEAQIKEAFNAPIYIVGFSVDVKYLYQKVFKHKK